jgi:hypothetical protein
MNKIINKKMIGTLYILVLVGLLVAMSPMSVYAADPNDWTQDGNTLTGEKYLGTDSNHDLPIRTNGNEVMRITTGGNVGIGTDSTPDAMLEIAEAGTIPFMISNTASGDGDFLIMDTNGRLGIGDTSPDFKLEVTGSSGSGYFGVTSSSPPNLILSGILDLFF